MELERKAILISCLLILLVVLVWSPTFHAEARLNAQPARGQRADGRSSGVEARETSAVQPSAKNIGSWTAPAYLCPPGDVCTVGVFAALLHTGQVLYYYRPPVGQMGSRAVLLDPVSGALTDVLVPFPRDIFCSGISVMEDGRVLVTGGDYPGRSNGTSGTVNTTLFDPATNTWSEGSDMAYARWYPSTIELGDGTMLEFGGTEEDGVTEAVTVESYNYDNDTWVSLPSSANLPMAVNRWYPRLTLLTSGKVFSSAPGPYGYTLDLTTDTWTYIATNNYGARYHGAHVLLPGLNKVMAAGGTSDAITTGGGPATNTAEVIDFTSKTPAWSYINPMTYARNNLNLVLLPDGTVMAVGGGGGNGKYANPVLIPELYNPITGIWNILAAQAVQRTYHSTALLLPDGRVLSAGSDNGEDQQTTYEIYSPPYLFKGQRPVISSAPASVVYGQDFTINTVNAPSITHVALIRPSTNSHADGFDQRYINLAFTIQKGRVTATAPQDGNHAPPGYYMLVILNSSGIPSVMPFVQLSDGE